MNMYLTLCDFINSWFGTSFGKPSKRFRKREFYKGQYYPKKFIITLNQHLLLHQFLYDLIPSDSRTKFEHDVAVKQLLLEHVIARAAWYSEDVFKYVYKEANVPNTYLPHCLEAASFNYPLYEFTTSDNFAECLRTTSYARHDLNDSPPNMKRDCDDEPMISDTLVIGSAGGLSQLSHLDIELVDIALGRYVQAMDDISIINGNNIQLTLDMIKGIQKVLEAVCFMDGVFIKPSRAEELVAKLTLCNEHRYGISPNEDNPTRRCLAMLVGGKFNRGIILNTYMIQERTDVVSKWAMTDISRSGGYVYFAYDTDALLGKAKQSITFGPRHQWFQVFEFNRVLRLPPRGTISKDRLVYRDEIFDFRPMLFGDSQRDKHLEAWDNIPATNMIYFLKEETL